MNKSNTLGVVHNMSQRSCQRWVRPSYCSPEQEPHICMCYTELHLSNATRIFELTMFGMSFHNGSKQFPSDDYPGFVQQCTWWRIYLNRKHSLDILFCTLALWLVLTLECAEDLPARRAQSLGRHSWRQVLQSQIKQRFSNVYRMPNQLVFTRRQWWSLRLQMTRWIHWSEVQYVFPQYTIVCMFACKRVINRRFERHSVVYESDS